MKIILTNKKGVTLLEGLIALGLLAMVATGTFGVLLSVAHKSGKPDIQEEMALAVEKVNDYLHAYSSNMDGDLTANNVKLCDSDAQTHPLALGAHTITCMLPVICDRNNDRSSFSYNVANSTLDFKSAGGGNASYITNDNYGNTTSTQRKITYSITCNGFVL